MSSPYICVAGLLNDGTHVRPVIHGQLHRNLLRSRGGVFEIGAVVSVGTVTDVGSAPEVEDRLFDPANAEHQGLMGSADFWELLEASAEDNLIGIFGPALNKRGALSCGIDVHCGVASLGLLSPQQQPRIYRREREGKPDDLRLELEDPSLGRLNLGITDIRFYGPDHITPDFTLVKSVNDRIQGAVSVILSVGLTRPFPANSPLHWLQVNNVHLEDDPLWNLEQI